MRRGLQFLCFIAAAMLLATGAYADKRVALVIGNSGYQNVPALPNPTNDSAAIADSLTRIGFTVTNLKDLDFDGMRRALRDFSGSARGADIAMIYYAGHGMEIGGENYLVPIDARLATDGDVPYEAISLELALSALEGTRGTRIVLLDACRDNPFATKMKVTGDKSRSIGRGLARVEPSVGTLVAYAAKEGTTAQDGDSGHSPFTHALLEHMEEPGVDIQFLFREVRDSVLAETDGGQEPFTYGSLPGKQVFLSPVVAPVPAPAPIPAPAVTEAAPVTPTPPPLPPSVTNAADELAADVAFWNSIKDTNDRALLESYLKQYPNGRFSGLAHIFLSRLDVKPATPVVADAGPAKVTPRDVPTPPKEGATTDATATPDATADATATPDATAEATVAPDATVEPDTSAALAPTPTPTPAPAAASDAQTKIASLPPAVDTTPVVAVHTPDLNLAIQTELVRVGCLVGAPVNAWGSRSRAALRDFIRYADLKPGPADPSEDYLSSLKSHRGRVCPIVCGPRFQAQGDECIAKTCPPRKYLNDNGDCVASPKVVIKRAGNTNLGGSGGGRCHEESVAQCVDRLSSGGRATGHGRVDDLVAQTSCTNPERRLKVCN